MTRLCSLGFLMTKEHEEPALEMEPTMALIHSGDSCPLLAFYTMSNTKWISPLSKYATMEI